MTDRPSRPSRPERIETCRWSLVLGLVLLGASVTGAALALTRLSTALLLPDARASAGLPAAPGSARADGEALEPGLLAEVWSPGARPADLEARPALTRIDPRVDFDPQAVGHPPTTREGLSVRWTGLVRIPRDARYRFFTRSAEGSRLFIDDQPIALGAGDRGAGEAAGEATLTAGDHALRLEIVQGTAEAGCSLLWESEGLAKEVIPAAALFHRRTAVGR